jgi:AmmeMemoRadiSam system protein B
MFYPADPAELSRMVRGFLNHAQPASADQPKAIIVPHAGYVYSGAIAASGYMQVKPEGIKRVVLLGPAHRVLFQGLAAPETLRWQTPLGNVKIDFELLEKISRFPQVLFCERAHQQEHSLEVQLPFLQERVGDFKLVPLAVGDASPEEVSEVLNALWGGQETLIVVSSDLSHYERYGTAVEKDRITAKAIADLNIRGLDSDSACGLIPIAGLVHQARQRGMRAELLDLRNSGDTAGPKDQVVGYGAFAFYD